MNISRSVTLFVCSVCFVMCKYKGLSSMFRYVYHEIRGCLEVALSVCTYLWTYRLRLGVRARTTDPESTTPILCCPTVQKHFDWKIFLGVLFLWSIRKSQKSRLWKFFVYFEQSKCKFEEYNIYMRCQLQMHYSGSVLNTRHPNNRKIRRLDYFGSSKPG